MGEIIRVCMKKIDLNARVDIKPIHNRYLQLLDSSEWILFLTDGNRGSCLPL